VLTETALRLSLLTLPSNPDFNFSLAPTAALAMQLGSAQLAGMDEASPAWLFLAVRAARRATQAAPEDALAWQQLGDAYQRLYEHTSERTEYINWFGLRQLRSAQVIAAWQQALKLNPQLDSTRLNLANLYQRLDQPELALPLFQQLLARQKRSGAGAEPAAEFQARMRAMDENVAALERSVIRKRELHEANAANLNVEDRAADAVKRGLAQLALEIMLGADVASFGRPGLNLEMELLLLHGRVFDVREWLTESYQNLLTDLDYRWIRARMYAATGDYAGADDALQRMMEISATPQNGSPGTFPVQISSSVALVLLEALNPTPTPMSLLQSASNRTAVFKNTIEQLFFLRQYAEFEVLRGLLALEAGNIPLAEKCFQASTAMWGGEEAERTGAGIDFNGRRLAQHYLRVMEAARR
jgi:tetratricopeptide (TPR) repeat protein